MARPPRWRPYVAQHERRASSAASAQQAAARGESWAPVRPEPRGRKLCSTVWGTAWCENLERYHDYANRLPRGRTYLRNGSVAHLEITTGRVAAHVQGSSLYRVEIEIEPIAARRWSVLTKSCAAGIGSMIELLEGRLSAEVMGVMTAKGSGLFPEPREIVLRCSCPDWATMCKHVAAVMYGVGVRLDDAPALLFALRGVDPSELVSDVGTRALVGIGEGHDAIAEDDLAGIFGIEIAMDVPRVIAMKKAKVPRTRAKKKTRKTVASKKPARARKAASPQLEVARKDRRRRS